MQIGANTRFEMTFCCDFLCAVGPLHFFDSKYFLEICLEKICEIKGTPN